MVNISSFTLEESFRSLDKFDWKVVKRFARAATECIIDGPVSYKNVDSEISDVDEATKIVENLMLLYLQCCRDNVSAEKLKQFLESKQVNSRCAAVIANEYNESKCKICNLKIEANNMFYYYDLQWRVEAKVGSRSLPNQLVPLISMDFKFGDSSVASETKRICHEILQTDPVTLLSIADSLEKALSVTRSRNFRKMQKHMKKIVLDS